MDEYTAEYSGIELLKQTLRLLNIVIASNNDNSETTENCLLAIEKLIKSMDNLEENEREKSDLLEVIRIALYVLNNSVVEKTNDHSWDHSWFAPFIAVTRSESLKSQLGRLQALIYANYNPHAIADVVSLLNKHIDQTLKNSNESATNFNRLFGILSTHLKQYSDELQNKQASPDVAENQKPFLRQRRECATQLVRELNDFAKQWKNASSESDVILHKIFQASSTYLSKKPAS
jgi:hypothetical protein